MTQDGASTPKLGLGLRFTNLWTVLDVIISVSRVDVRCILDNAAGGHDRALDSGASTQTWKKPEGCLTTPNHCRWYCRDLILCGRLVER